MSGPAAECFMVGASTPYAMYGRWWFPAWWSERESPSCGECPPGGCRWFCCVYNSRIPPWIPTFLWGVCLGYCGLGQCWHGLIPGCVGWLAKVRLGGRDRRIDLLACWFPDVVLILLHVPSHGLSRQRAETTEGNTGVNFCLIWCHTCRGNKFR